MENRKQALGYTALCFFPPKYPNNDVTGRRREGGSWWKKAKSIPDGERILSIEPGAVSDCGVWGRTEPIWFPRNPTHEICALDHQTGAGAGWPDRHAHRFSWLIRQVQGEGQGGMALN